MLTWINAVIPGLLLDSHWWLEPMCWGTRHAWDPMFIEWVMVFLFESLRGWGSCRNNRFWHLPVVIRAIISRNSWLRREGVAGFRQLSLKSARRKKLHCLRKNRMNTYYDFSIEDYKFKVLINAYFWIFHPFPQNYITHFKPRESGTSKKKKKCYIMVYFLCVFTSCIVYVYSWAKLCIWIYKATICKYH